MRKILRPLIVGLLSLFALPAFATTPVVRGYSYRVQVTSQLVLGFPSGSAVGDLAILFYSAGDNSTVPVGWTQFYQTPLNSNDWVGVAAGKVLTASDISDGQIILSVSNGVSFDMAAGMAVYEGSTVNGVEEGEYFTTAGDEEPYYLTTSSNPLAGDVILFWGSDRGDPTKPFLYNSEDTCCGGSGTLTQIVSLESTNTWSVFATQVMTAGSMTAGYSFPNPGGGNGEDGMQVVVNCKAVGGAC